MGSRDVEISIYAEDARTENLTREVIVNALAAAGYELPAETKPRHLHVVRDEAS